MPALFDNLVTNGPRLGSVQVRQFVEAALAFRESVGEGRIGAGHHTGGYQSKQSFIVPGHRASVLSPSFVVFQP